MSGSENLSIENARYFIKLGCTKTVSKGSYCPVFKGRVLSTRRDTIAVAHAISVIFLKPQSALPHSQNIPCP